MKKNFIISASFLFLKYCLNITIFLDSLFEGSLQNGSLESPFSKINDAFNYISKHNNSQNDLILLSNSYNYELNSTFSCKNHLNISYKGKNEKATILLLSEAQFFIGISC